MPRMERVWLTRLWDGSPPISTIFPPVRDESRPSADVRGGPFSIARCNGVALGPARPPPRAPRMNDGCGATATAPPGAAALVCQPAAAGAGPRMMVYSARLYSTTLLHCTALQCSAVQCKP